jgi:DNA-binding NarL/FixJ family response regulator
VVATHRTVRAVIEAACREAGVTVVDRAETAAAATEACRSARPDLLVLDLELPDADGFRVLADLDDDRPRAVLVLADRADGDLVLRALRLGAHGYVTKAEGLRDLTATIRRVLAGERVMTPALEKDAMEALGRMARRAREGADVEAGLTRRERQVLELLGEGMTIGQIASRLGISPRTVETHVAKLYRKLGVRTRVQAISRAATLGLVDL